MHRPSAVEVVINRLQFNKHARKLASINRGVAPMKLTLPARRNPDIEVRIEIELHSRSIEAHSLRTELGGEVYEGMTYSEVVPQAITLAKANYKSGELLSSVGGIDYYYHNGIHLERVFPIGTNNFMRLGGLRRYSQKQK